MEDKIPFIKNCFSMPVRPNSAHRLMPMIPVAAKGETPPPEAPSTDRAESIAGLMPSCAASVMEKTIMMAIVGTVPGPMADKTTEKT